MHFFPFWLVIDETDVKHWSLNSSVTSSHCFYLPLSFSSFCQPPSSALSLSCTYMCIIHLQSGVWDCCLVSLLHPAVNPLPSETLPFPFPDILTDMHTQTPANAQSMRNSHKHTPTYTLQTWATYSNLLHARAWMCLCVGICAYALVFVASTRCDIFSLTLSLSPQSYPQLS